MDKVRHEVAYGKTLLCVLSCKTLPQVESARKLVEFYNKMYVRDRKIRDEVKENVKQLDFFIRGKYRMLVG